MIDFDKDVIKDKNYSDYLSGHFCGCVMRADKCVAKITNNELTELTESAPIYLKRTRNLGEWIEDRGSDLTRSYVRSILKHLGIPVMNSVQSVLYVNAACLTDSFWIKSDNEKTLYSDVIFKDDMYYNAALRGDPDIFSYPRIASPELTNIGSYNKGWKTENGEWYLYKVGNKNEIFSELFTSNLCLALGLDAVKYSAEGASYIKCKNFIRDTDCFEPAKSIVNDNEEYLFNIEKLGTYNLVKQYMDIIFIDAIVRNSDRHTFNYGVITKDNGEIKMAPNFDNNNALFWNGIPTNLERNDVFVKDFAQACMATDYKLPELKEGMLHDVFIKTQLECATDINKEHVVEFCMNAYKNIIKKITGKTD